MTIALPSFQSQLSVPSAVNNFIAYQSAKINATTASSPVTFTAIQQSGRITAIFANTSTTVGSYIASGTGTATAFVSTTSPQPSTGTAISPCFYLAPGAIYTLDFVEHTDTFAAITSAGTATIEISIGAGS